MRLEFALATNRAALPVAAATCAECLRLSGIVSIYGRRLRLRHLVEAQPRPGVSTFGAALERWHRGAVPRIIAGGEGRGFCGPNPRIKAKEKCAATAAREGAASAILRAPAGARSMVMLVPGVAGRKNSGPNPRLGFSAPLRGAKCNQRKGKAIPSAAADKAAEPPTHHRFANNPSRSSLSSLHFHDKRQRVLSKENCGKIAPCPAFRDTSAPPNGYSPR